MIVDKQRKVRIRNKTSEKDLTTNREKYLVHSVFVLTTFFIHIFKFQTIVNCISIFGQVYYYCHSATLEHFYQGLNKG